MGASPRPDGVEDSHWDHGIGGGRSYAAHWEWRRQTRSPGVREIVKTFNIFRKDLDKYGPTPGCAACEGLMRTGKRTGQHTDACRGRIRIRLAQDEDPRASREQQRCMLPDPPQEHRPIDDRVPVSPDDDPDDINPGIEGGTSLWA